MADKEHFTTEKVIAAIRDRKGNLSAVADTLGCNRSTVYNYCDRHATVRQALEDERERMVDVAESALQLAIFNKEAWAISLTLKTLGRKRGYVERTENVIQGDPEKPQIIEVRGIDYRTFTPKLAPRSVPDSDASGQDEGASDGQALG